MIKQKSPFPFEIIGAAIAFSPRIEEILCEVKRLAQVFSSKVILMHVGDRTKDKEDRLGKLLEKNNYSEIDYKVIWESGDPVDTILRLSKENVVDLLVAGALEKENILKYYIGSISREICRRAKCSVLMLTEPSLLPQPFKKIIVNGVESPKTIHTVQTALYVARHENSEEVTIVKERHHIAHAMTIADDVSKPELQKLETEMAEEEARKIDEILHNIDHAGLTVKAKMLSGKPGFAISKYAATTAADLLVINSPDNTMTILDRVFTHDIEFVLAELPCNLLIVHSRI